MNKVILHGKVARKDEIKTVGSGIEILRFSLAVDRKVSKDKPKESDFLPCTVFGKTAAFVDKYFNVGDGMMLEGRIQVRTYEKDGEKRTAFDINVDNVEFAEKKGGGINTAHGHFEEIEPGSDEDPFAVD